MITLHDCLAVDVKGTNTIGMSPGLCVALALTAIKITHEQPGTLTTAYVGSFSCETLICGARANNDGKILRVITSTGSSQLRRQHDSVERKRKTNTLTLNRTTHLMMRTTRI